MSFFFSLGFLMIYQNYTNLSLLTSFDTEKKNLHWSSNKSIVYFIVYVKI